MHGGNIPTGREIFLAAGIAMVGLYIGPARAL
jgi:hypothetical protein